MSYPLYNDAYSGAGYTEIVSVEDGELCFSVSSERDEDINLTVRGRGNATAEIYANGNAYPLVFNEHYLWKEVGLAVHLCAGQNLVRIRKRGDAGATLEIDYIEFEHENKSIDSRFVAGIGLSGPYGTGKSRE